MGMDVDMSMREEHGDVDMYSDSPAKVVRRRSHDNADARDNADEARNGEPSAKTTTSLLSSVLRPINDNAVKRVEKQRSKTSRAQALGGNASGARPDNALVRREDGATEVEASEYSSEEEEDPVSDLRTFRSSMNLCFARRILPRPLLSSGADPVDGTPRPSLPGTSTRSTCSATTARTL